MLSIGVLIFGAFIFSFIDLTQQEVGMNLLMIIISTYGLILTQKLWDKELK